MRRLLLAVTLLLLVGVPGVQHALAVGRSAQVAVTSGGAVIAGQQVTVMASEGAYQGVTDQNGQYAVTISGNYYRIRVNGKAVPGVFQVTQGVVHVDLNTL